MARKKSVILTPTEKKQAVASSKEAIKAAKVRAAALARDRKMLDKTYAAAVKLNDKEVSIAFKEMSAAEMQLGQLTTPALPPTGKATPSPTA